MLQIYSFMDADRLHVYRQANLFLLNLDTISGVQVKPEDVRPNTKTYMDYGSSITTIDVVVDIKGSTQFQGEVAERVEKIHAAIVAVPVATEHPTADPVTVPASDDFVPFLDGDDLP
jgi:hypothetical protein